LAKAAFVFGGPSESLKSNAFLKKWLEEKWGCGDKGDAGIEKALLPG
jgi:hypothetical protein